MTPIAFGMAAGLIALQASIAGPREAYSECLAQASKQAMAQKVAPDQYSAFAVQQCAAQGASFKSALIAFDVKNGVKRAQATADAQLQLDDYVAMSAENYEARAPKAAQSAAPTPTPAPVQAAAPKKEDN
jgi:hypothetical protein